MICLDKVKKGRKGWKEGKIIKEKGKEEIFKLGGKINKMQRIEEVEDEVLMRVELSIIIDKLKKKILKKVEGGLSGGIYDKDGSVDEREEEGREIFKRKEMLLIGEVGKRIEKNERMDVVNEGIDGSKNEKDMGVDEEDNKLVEVKVFNELKKVGKMEGDVEKFGKKSIGGEGSKFVKDEMMLRRGGGKERKKNIVEKGEVE